MSRRFSWFGGAAAILLLWQVAAIARPACSTLLATQGTTRYVEIDRSHVKLDAALPDYDPETEFLFHCYPDGHAVFYTGKYFVESNGIDGRTGVHVISQGVTVRVHVGKELVAKLEANIEAQLMANCKYWITCHHRLIFLLSTAEIYMEKGPFLFGSSTLESMMAHGFKDGRGRHFSHDVHVINHSPAEHLGGIRSNIQSYELGGSHSFFAGVLGHLGYTREELQADISAHSPNPLVPEMLAKFADPANYPNIPQAIKDAGQALLQTTEKKFIARVEAASGRPLQDAFMQFSQLGFGDYVPWAKAAFRESLIEALKEMR